MLFDDTEPSYSVSMRYYEVLRYLLNPGSGNLQEAPPVSVAVAVPREVSANLDALEDRSVEIMKDVFMSNIKFLSST